MEANIRCVLAYVAIMAIFVYRHTSDDLHHQFRSTSGTRDREQDVNAGLRLLSQ